MSRSLEDILFSDLGHRAQRDEALALRSDLNRVYRNTR